MLVAKRDEAIQQLKKEQAKRKDWSAFGDEWDMVEKKFRMQWRPTPYGGDRRQQGLRKEPETGAITRPRLSKKTVIGAHLSATSKE